GLVPHGDARAHRQRAAFVDVQHARFLDVAARLDDDGRVVAADGDVRPDADAGLQRDVADDVGAVGHVGAGVDGGNELVELVDGHAAVSGRQSGLGGGARFFALPQHPTLDFTGGGHGKFVDELDFLRVLVGRQAVSHV